MLTIADAICVKLLSTDEICYGVGNTFHYIFRDEKKTLPVKSRDKIQNISVFSEDVNNYKIILAAGRELIICNLVNKSFEKIQKFVLNDWIICVKVYGLNNLLIVTGHNVAIELEIKPNNQVESRQKVACEDNSTLYCAKIEGISYDASLILSGTALGELVLWNPKKTNILYRTSAHNGVIFSFDCNLENNFLTTTSDDRSVKFWNFQYDNKIDTCEIKELKCCFGHTARVFRSKIITHDKKLFVISVGEDSNICIWNSIGTLIHKKFAHNGATIWNIDYDYSTQTVFTCGSNGNINKYYIGNILDSNLKIHEKFIDYQESFSKLRFVDDLIAITSSNKLLVYKDGRNFIEYTSERLQCSLLEAKKKQIYVIDKSVIKIFEYDDKIELKSEKSLDFQLENKTFSLIRSLSYVSDDKILVCNNQGKCLLVNNKSFDPEKTFIIPQCAERWITSVCNINDELILIGDRCGSLHLYDINIENPISTLKRLHGNLGITNILQNEEDENSIYFTTSGHDGTLKEVQMNKSNQKLILFNTSKIPVAWIEEIKKIDNMRFIFGFNDKHFVVFEKTEGIVFQFNCGGGHRFWHVQIDENSKIAKFIYLQNKKVASIDFELIQNCKSTINVRSIDWHIKSCNSVNIISNSYNQFFISGGEDNLIKIGHFGKLNNNFTICSNVLSHISSIKCVRTKTLPNNDILVFSVGGRAQLCITRIINCKDVRYRDEFSYMLYQTDEQRCRKQRSKVQEISFDPETRFMCISFYEDDKIVIGCSDGYIRFYNLILNDDDSSFCIQPYMQIFYGKCILNVHCFKIDSQTLLLTMGTDGFICFWNLKDENLSSVTKPIHKLKHHDSGVNCFDLNINKNIGYIATGGDDQKVALTEFEVISSDSFVNVKIKKTVTNNSSHTAQVTGIKIVDGLFILSTGVDQNICKINLDSFKIENCYSSCISDIKGLVISEDKKLFVYGSGIEFLNIL